MICDDKTPGELLLDKDYLRKYNPTIELINGNKSLLLNLYTTEQIGKLCDSGPKHNDSIQVIMDSTFIKGIDGYVYFN